MDTNRLFDLTGKVAVVSGGATGIGRMITEALASAGARVLIFSRKQDVCTAFADELNAQGLSGTVEGFEGDLGSEEGISATYAKITARTQSVHILVNNAGLTWGAPLGKFPHKAWGKVMDVNVAGLFQLTQALLPQLNSSALSDDPARVVNIGSVVGEREMGDGAYSYAASKAAVHHLTRILASELAEQSITVNAIAPGPFVSRMTAFATGNDDGREIVGKKVPLGRVGRETDIAGCLLFLCGLGGAYVTGAIIPVSGGLNVVAAPNLFEHAM